MPLTNQEQKRYNRHIILHDIRIQGQEKIKETSILVVGAGGLGSPILYYLTAAGVGHIGIMDDDVVSESNLQRQILYDTTHVGTPKVTVATTIHSPGLHHILPGYRWITHWKSFPNTIL